MRNLGALLIWVVTVSPGLACSVCNADPHSPTTHAANLAIITMLICVGAVLGTIAHVGRTWSRRAEALELARLAKIVAS